MNLVTRKIISSFSGLFVCAILFLLVAGCNVNQTIRVAYGSSISDSLRTVNGSVLVGSGCEVRGECKTVNGSVHVGDQSTVQSLGTVNGSVKVGHDVKINGSLKTINGSIECASGCEVKSEISTINGSIKLDGTKVAKDVSTINGGILLDNGSRVEGDLVIGHNRGNSNPSNVYKVVIKNGSVLVGNVIVKDKERKVEVHLDATSRIDGEIQGAELIREPEVEKVLL